MKAIVAVAILCAMALNLAAGSDQKPSTISDARAAIEKNMSTPLGKAYDKQLGQGLMQHYADSMRHCKQTAGGAEESFWILMKLGQDGSVKELLLSPETKIGQCDREVLTKARFTAPPRADYWVGIYLKLAH
jgi:hypothetical protein